MERGAGQQYIPSVFGRGIAQDIAFDLPLGQNRDTYIQSDRMAVNQDLINGLRQVNGDISVGTVHSATTVTRVLAVHEMAGHLYTFLGFSTTSLIRIFRDTTLIGEHADYPGDYYPGYLYVDGNPNSGELAITDNDQVPIILDVDDMYYEAAIAAGFPTTKYFTDYDKTLYEVNRAINLTQPVFRGLNEVGVGGGLKTGSYAYAYRLVSDNGDETPWSPPTPFIPVPSSYGQGTQPDYLPGARTYGEDPSLNPTKYGIDIAFRIVNESGYDFVELKRIPNNVGGPVEYTASPQFIRLETSISETIVSVVRFTDLYTISWAALDDSNTIGNSIIATSRTVRFYDNRLIMGGVTYESRILDNSVVSSVAGEVFKENIGVAGYTDIHNQVYKKSQRLGEKYGYALQGLDNAGARSFAIPMTNDSLSNFKFPERREAYSGDNAVEAALVDSDAALSTGGCYEVYTDGKETKDTPRLINIVEGIDSDVDGSDEIYRPLHPTQREDSDSIDASQRACDIVEGSAPGTGTSYIPKGYGPEIMATGMRLTGIDAADFPNWCSGLSVLRSPSAGRVVAQGIGMYSMIPGELNGAGTDVFAHKALDKLWIHSPELDSVIGNKSGLLEDIVANYEDYEIQLVSPVGFFPEFYSGISDHISSGYGAAIDMALMATKFYTSDDISPFDSDALTGRGDGYATFGRWRNQSAQGADIDYATNKHIFSMTGASIAAVINPNWGNDMSGRSSYLEVTLDGDIYSNEDVGGITQGTSRVSHEPFYIVNIIKSGAQVSDNNSDIFNEIGHYINFRSLIGYGSGELDQSVEITSERISDFHWPSTIQSAYTPPNASDEYSYIWVNGQRWLNVTHWLSADITTIETALYSASSFAVAPAAGGDTCETCYGIYDVSIKDGVYYINFQHQTVGATPTDIIPAVNEIIEVRYDSSKPIDILLGDTVIGPASFVPIDCDVNLATNSYGQLFKISKAFPFDTFQFKYDTNPVFHTPYDPSTIAAAEYQSGLDVDIDFVRQMLVMFMCESTVNLPLIHKDFFPYKNYVMRPVLYPAKADNDSELAYIRAVNLHDGYVDDYPGEYLNWGYGGFHFPQGYNFDYNKQHRDIYTELPIEVTEILDYPKRLHWGSKRGAASISRGISRSFPVTNVYDILLKDASEINILYSHYSTKGNNLYAVMDRGVVGLLTDKNVLRDGVADELGVILSNSEFIQGEIILDPWVGCPDKHWRGRAEGSIKTPQNVHIPGLVFPGDDDIYLLSGNGVVSIGTNYRDTLVPLIKTIGDSSILTSTFDHARNELWFKIDGTIHLFGFSINNWVGQVSGTNIAALANAKIYDSTKVVRIGVTNYYNAGTSTVGIYKSYTGNIFASDVESEHPVNSTTFAVTPPGLAQVEFTDIFINSSQVPSEVVVSTSYPFNDTYTLNTLKDVNGLYRATLGRTVGGNTLVGNTLYVRVEFPFETAVDLGYVKTGFKKVTGG